MAGAFADLWLGDCVTFPREPGGTEALSSSAHGAGSRGAENQDDLNMLTLRNIQLEFKVKKSARETTKRNSRWRWVDSRVESEAQQSALFVRLSDLELQNTQQQHNRKSTTLPKKSELLQEDGAKQHPATMREGTTPSPVEEEPSLSGDCNIHCARDGPKENREKVACDLSGRHCATRPRRTKPSVVLREKLDKSYQQYLQSEEALERECNDKTKMKRLLDEQLLEGDDEDDEDYVPGKQPRKAVSRGRRRRGMANENRKCRATAGWGRGRAGRRR